MLVERRVDLVVEVVEERGDAPELLVPAELARVRGRRRLDGERVTEQRLALRVLRERLPGLFASRCHGAASIARYGRRTRARRRLRDRGRQPLSGTHPRRRQQERRAADPRRVPAHRRAGDAHERAAHPRRRHDARAARRPRRRRRRGRGRTRCASTPRTSSKSAPDPRALQHDPRVVPARRPAARALRPRDDAAAGRRRDRPAPARPAHPRVRRARRRDRHRRPLRDRAPTRLAARRLPRRGERHGDGEHRHGRGARAGRDGARQRGVRAARAGPLPLPRLARRADRGHRVERAAHHRRRAAARRRVDDRPGPHRGRAASSAWPRSPAATSRSRASRPTRPRLDRARRSRSSASASSSARTACTCRPAAADRRRTTSAARSRRSRTGPGRRSRPTSRRSR